MTTQLIPDTIEPLISGLANGMPGTPQWQSAWGEFLNLYNPTLLRWCRRWGGAEADDLLQDVLLLLSKIIGSYNFERKKRFRSWLKTVAYHEAATAYRRRMKKQLPLVPLSEDLPTKDAIESLGQDLDISPQVEHLVRHVKERVEPHVWQAYWEYKINDRPLTEVARELGMRPQSICNAAKRVNAMLRRQGKVAPSVE